MAKKSPADLKAEGKELSGVIAGLRKKTHNFAMLLSKDGVILEVDKRKPPATLRKNAKSAGGGPKGAMGQMRCKGKIIQLTVEDDEVPDMVLKAAKKHFQERGIGIKFEVLQTIEDDDEEDQEDDAAEETPRAGASQEEEAPQERRGASAATDARAGGAGAPEGGSASDSSQEAEAGADEGASDEKAAASKAKEMDKKMDDIEADAIHIEAYGSKGEIKKLAGLKNIFEAAKKEGDAGKGDKILQSIKGMAKKIDVVLNEGAPERDPEKAAKLAADLEALKKEIASLPG